MAIAAQSNAVCKNCEEPLEAGWSRCPSCGTASGTGTGQTCPSCGRTVKAKWRHCPDCQTPLSGENTPTGASVGGQDDSSGSPKQKHAQLFVTQGCQPNRPEELPNLTGKNLGERYRIQDHLGTGGFGAVYAAYDEVTHQDIALKIVVVPSDGEQAQGAVDQILQEFRLRQKINEFTHVVRCEDPRICDLNGLSLILLPMELASDGSFRRWLQANPDKDKRRAGALTFFRQACLGVKAIHHAGQAHLDLKPENILIKDGKAKITDFGIGRFASLAMGCNPEQLVRAGMGTPRYMSPEQFETARQQDVGASSDIYGLGVILFEILDGATPFDGSRAELQRKHQNVAPPTLKGPAAAWARIVERCLAKAPDQRYDNVEAIITDLDRVEQGAATSVDVSCPKCGRLNPNPEHKICANCQTSLAKHFRPCPTCAKEVRLDVETCTGCGEAVLAYHLRQERWKSVTQLKDEDPVEAISLLERMVRDGAKELGEPCIAELKRLRGNQTTISKLITAASQAAVDGQIEVAIKAWRDVLKLAPRHRAASEKVRSLDTQFRMYRDNLSKGRLLMDQGDFVQGDACFQRCLQLVPCSDEARRHLEEGSRRATAYAAAMQEAIICQGSKQLMTALERVNRAVAQAPQSPRAIELQAALHADIDETDGLLRRAEQRRRSAQFEKAFADLKAVEMRRSDAGDLSLLGAELAISRECYTRAMEECDRAINKRDLAVAETKIGEALKQCPESSPAQTMLKKIRDDSAGAKQHLQKSKSLLLEADFQGSAQELEHARNLWSTMPGLNETGVNIKSTQSAYERHLADAEQARAKRAYDVGRAACERAFALCSESQQPKLLYRRITDEEAAGKLRQEQKSERARERRSKLWNFTKLAILLLIILALLGVMARLALMCWAQAKALVPIKIVEHTNLLFGTWGILLLIAACVHRARYTDLFRGVLFSWFNMQSDRMGATWIVVVFILAVLSSLPSACVYYLAENYFEVTRNASIALGSACGVLVQIATLIYAIKCRCQWRLT